MNDWVVKVVGICFVTGFAYPDIDSNRERSLP